MIFGMTPFLFGHVLLSLLGIAAGFVVLFFGFLTSRRLAGWTVLFLATTVLTSATGFGLPADKLLPSHIVGIISLVVLAIALLALYQFRLAGGWRRVYVITAVLALYLNFFVLIAQSFAKIPALHAMAPTQAEPPFVIAQAAALVIFLILGTLAVKQFHPNP
jgi:hypothetical protein